MTAELVTPEYRRFRERMWERGRGLCALCLRRGRHVRAAELDHIVPRSRGGAVTNESNVQLLCLACHRAKTRSERPGRGIEATEEGFPLHEATATWPLP